MPIRTIITFAIAIILGLVAVAALNIYMGSQKKAVIAAQPAAVAGSPVVVASQPIARGIPIQANLLKVVNYPAGSVPTGAFSSVQQLTSNGAATPRLATRDLGIDEPVLATRVTPPGGKLDLAEMITPGMQAIAIRDGDVPGVGGFVVPGDHVDILLTRSIPPDSPMSGGAASVTQMVAQNVKVIGIDQNNNDETGVAVVAKSATVEVTPDQAQTITLAQTMGALSLSLRHVQDAQPAPRQATKSTQFGFYVPPKRAGPPPSGLVRVTRDTDTTEYTFTGR
jgi:pilus assembly protein CpaB